ncbi:PhoH family protein [Draconibacterium halophilum]|uniref:PhoH-like protein n=1 Tax=Draconibacterium halophilum TaxID=2706887 RepID=A0A6C0RDB2_9BACT|nr:PhoH family protein [Draconibacterium halophilum]QIA07725.1 PhoH family protein [Draconibacterium halophilum]
MDKQILLEGIDLLEFFGVNNSKIELVKRLFPKIKITARGHALFVQGEPKEINTFEKKFALILDHYYQYNMLTEETIHEILDAGVSSIEENGSSEPDIIVFGNSGKPVRARTPNQRRLVEANSQNDLIFAIGPAGTGKTYTAIALAVRALKNKEIKKIILSRPAVEAGENLGFLPGDLKEKIDPYLQPLYDALQDMIPPKKLEEFLKDGVIQIAPLAFMRGRTLSNAYVILDEAQNTTVNQLKMFLTRMGLNAKFIITGDVTQIDLPRKSHSGLIQALRILKGIKNISTIYFDKKDIVRHRLVRDIVEAYDKYDDQKIEIKTDSTGKNAK